MSGMKVKTKQTDQLIIEIELHINQRLFDRGAVSEEMYRKAKEAIISAQGRGSHGPICDTQ